MGRLIDADKLLRDFEKRDVPEILEKYCTKTILYAIAEDLFHCISEQPTAYDVDKVIENIDGMFGADPAYFGKEAQFAVETAIMIVRSGGVDCG